MKLFLWASIYLLCMPLITVSSSKQNKVETIVSMRCVSTDWSVLIRSSQTPSKFLMRPKELKDSTITYDKSYLQALQSHINKLQQTSDVVNIDVRTVCLLETDKGTVDTLSLGDFDHCQYNNKSYYLTWELLQSIMQKLPHEQYEDINLWLQNDPSIKERMIENGKR